MVVRCRGANKWHHSFTQKTHLPKKESAEKECMNPIEIPSSTLHHLIQKWNDEWTGSYIQQMRGVHEDTFILKIHTKKNNVEVLIALPYLIMEAQRKWENADEQPAIVNAT